MSGVKYGSGRSLFLGRGRVVTVPIENTLPAANYEGAMVYGSDGILYYSNGIEWAPPVDQPPITRPTPLTPTNAVQQTQLRLSNFFSEAGLIQEAAFFEVSLDPTFQSVLFTRTLLGAGINSYQILETDGLEFGQTFYWRGRYSGGGQESLHSRIAQQGYPFEIQRPEPVTFPNAIAIKLEITAFDTAFNTTYNETQWEVYDNPEASGSPLWTGFTSGVTTQVPDFADAETFYWRARYLGTYQSLSGPVAVTSPWSVMRPYVQAALGTILIYDTNLVTGTTIAVPINGTVNCTIDWGDGVVENVNASGDKSHTYAVDGTYQVRITGTLTQLGRVTRPFDAIGYSQAALIECKALGFANGLTSLAGAFAQASNLVTVPSVIPKGITSLRGTFLGCSIFNGPLALWDVSAVTNLEHTFRNSAAFNQNIGAWDVSKVTSMWSSFHGAAAFNNGGSPSIDNWNTETLVKVADQGGASQDRGGVFTNATSFNQPIGKWKMGKVTSLGGTQHGAFENASAFNQNIGAWNVSKVTDFRRLFRGATAFNNGGSPSIQNWAVNASGGHGSRFDQMFLDAEAFNQAINNWQPINLTSLVFSFQGARAFNQDLDLWNTSTLTNLDHTFDSATNFNGDVTTWNVAACTNFRNMFRNATVFNRDISGWNTASANSFQAMFQGTPFNQNIGAWPVTTVTSFANMFFNSNALSTANYDALLIGWAAQTVQTGRSFNAGNAKYSPAAAAARDTLVTTYAWTITDGGPA